MARTTSEALSSTRESANQLFASQLSTATAQLSKVTESLNKLGVAEHLGKLADASEDAHLALSESVDEIRTVVQEMQKLELRIASINPVIEIENARANVARLSAAIQECESSAKNASGGMLTSRPHSASDTSTLSAPHLERERAIQPALVPADGT